MGANWILNRSTKDLTGHSVGREKAQDASFNLAMTILSLPLGGIMAEGMAAKEGFSTLTELGLQDGMEVSSSKALELGEKFLGKGYTEPVPGSGRFVSADGTRVFRMGDSDILDLHGGGPHVNFETLIPNPAKTGKMMVDQNFHIFLKH